MGWRRIGFLAALVSGAVGEGIFWILFVFLVGYDIFVISNGVLFVVWIGDTSIERDRVRCLKLICGLYSHSVLVVLSD